MRTPHGAQRERRGRARSRAGDTVRAVEMNCTYLACASRWQQRRVHVLGHCLRRHGPRRRGGNCRLNRHVAPPPAPARKVGPSPLATAADPLRPIEGRRGRRRRGRPQGVGGTAARQHYGRNGARVVASHDAPTSAPAGIPGGNDGGEVPDAFPLPMAMRARRSAKLRRCAQRARQSVRGRPR